MDGEDNPRIPLSYGTSARIRYLKYHHCSMVNPYKMVVMSTDSLTMNRPDFATPVLNGYNPMPGSENLIVMGSNGCSEPGIGIVTGNTILSGSGIRVVNSAISHPAGKGLLQLFTKNPANLAPLVVFDYNALLSFDNRVVNLATDLFLLE